MPIIQEQEFSNKELERLHKSALNEINFSLHAKKIDQDIRHLGAMMYDLWLPETQIMPYVVHYEEEVLGLVYGRYQQVEGDVIGRGVLIATPDRVILIDKKPLFTKVAEISYRVISAVTYSKVMFIGNVTIHTRMGKINVRTLNQKCAYNFVEAIESRLFANSSLDYQE